MARCCATIRNARGLHARAAAKFVKMAGDFKADVRVVKNGIEVSGRSIMGLLMLAAGPGSVIDIHAEGLEENEAIVSLSNLVSSNFEES